MADRFEPELVRTLRRDRQHGSSALAQRTLTDLADLIRNTHLSTASTLRGRLFDIADQIAAARPSMATIVNQMAWWKATLEDFNEDDLLGFRSHALAAIERLQCQSQQAVYSAAHNMSLELGPDQVVMTISLSSTVVRTFEFLAPRISAIVTESRPPGEGRTLVEQLSKLGITTDFITDAQMGHFISSATAAIVGADTVAVDGSILNKSGTYLLALAAREYRVPFYACFESFKLSKASPEKISLEPHTPDEFDPPKLPHVTAHNIYFELTPAKLVTAWITEHGVFKDFRQLPLSSSPARQ
ncbi:MAG: hypothetical protein OEU36_12085 [Gammaproteobacteria bacterium]|nr:hypothetical protein [Gammaproteobacteria bacterium]